MQKTFETPGPTSLYVELGSGRLSIRTEQTGTTTVDVRGSEAEDVIVERRGEQIVVLAPQQRTGFFGRGRDLDVAVSIPHDSVLSTRLGSADLTVAGRVGETMVKSGSGDVEIEVTAAEAMIQTGSGEIDIREAHGDLQVKSGSGDVEVGTLHGSASIATGSGDIKVRSAHQALEAKSGSGDLVIAEVHTDVSLNTASGDLAVHLAHQGQVRANNVSGDIRIGIPAGVPVWTDVTTLTGSVTSGLQGVGAPAEGQPFVELRARTVSGDVVLEQR
jgi:DUF4097 and DUF4098 domain-containing protein YvlB